MSEYTENLFFTYQRRTKHFMLFFFSTKEVLKQNLELNPRLKGYFEVLTERDRFTTQIDEALEPWDMWLLTSSLIDC